MPPMVRLMRQIARSHRRLMPFSRGFCEAMVCHSGCFLCLFSQKKCFDLVSSLCSEACCRPNTILQHQSTGSDLIRTNLAMSDTIGGGGLATQNCEKGPISAHSSVRQSSFNFCSSLFLFLLEVPGIVGLEQHASLNPSHLFNFGLRV